MNHSYRLIWSEVVGTWVAVSELAKSSGKRAGSAVLLTAATLLFAAAPSSAFAAPPVVLAAPAPTQLPSGGKVVAGSAAIAQSAATLNVTQTSIRAAIDWQSFNVGSAAQVNFVQPSASSVTLNRVLDSNPSQIFGRINATGQVFLTNPNGVYFAPGASVDVGGLLATTHRIGNAGFMAGNYVFDRNGATGGIVNDGQLNAALGGYIALLAPEVRNNGVIVAQLGTVALAAGEAFDLQFDANNTLANIRVAPATIATLVENGNAVHASGGLIILSAQAANRLQGGVIKNSGTLEATGLVSDGGRILLDASDRIGHSGSITADAAPNSSGKGGSVTLIANLANAGSTTEVSGSISAQGGSAGGDGGFVETSGAHLTIGATFSVDTSAAQGKTGTWLLDPVDFTIAASGGDITGAALGNLLANNSVTIETATAPSASATHLIGSAGSNGDIFVNDAVSWSANTALTLNAWRNININQSITASGATGSLALFYGQGAVATGNTATYNVNAPVNLRAGPNFSTQLGLDGTVKNYTVITSLGAAGSMTATDLQGINGGLSGNYVLGGNIDASGTSTWNGGAGFAPITIVVTMPDTSFRCIEFQMCRPQTQTTPFTGNFDGLGHMISGLTINRPAQSNIGFFGTTASNTSIQNLGLLGGTVTGQNTVGFLVGSNSSTIHNVYATGNVTGTAYLGGLIGQTRNTSINNSYATGNVTGTYFLGGLIGETSNTSINNSYATGNVTGTDHSIAGLIGYASSTSITNSYATGKPSGATRDVASGGLNQAGLVGGSYLGTFVNSFWDTTTTGQSYAYFNDDYAVKAYSVGSVGTVEGKITAELQAASTFTTAGWSPSVWGFKSGVNNGYPVLKAFYPDATFITTTAIYLRLLTGSSIYGDTPSFTYALYDASSGGNLVSDASPSGTVTWSTPLNATSAATTYGETYVSGLTLGNSTYSLSAGGSINWLINSRPFTITAGSTSRNYGSANPLVTAFTAATGSNGSGSGLVNGDSISGVVNTIADTATQSANAGTTHAITPSAAAFGSGTVGNYVITYVDGALSIGKADATVTANSKTVTYNGVDQSVTGFTASGLVAGESESVLGGVSATGTGKNAGSYDSVATGTDGNYNLTFVKGTLAIDKAALTVRGNSDSKVYDDVSYNGGNGVVYTGFVNDESRAVLSGALGYAGDSQGARIVGSYAITPAGLTSSNYQIAFLDGSLTIRSASPVVPRPLVITLPSGSDSGALRFVTTSPASAPPVLVARGETGGDGVILVAVPKSVVTSGGDFSFALPAAMAEAALDAPFQVSTVDGQPLPSWLQYVSSRQTFVASSMPAGAFPMELVVTIGLHRSTIVISEQTQ